MVESCPDSRVQIPVVHRVLAERTGFLLDSFPDTPWDCHLPYMSNYIDPQDHPNVGIYGSPMECLGELHSNVSSRENTCRLARDGMARSFGDAQ